MKQLIIPDTMWPIDESFFTGLGGDFAALINTQRLKKMQYPWNLLDFLLNQLETTIPRTFISNKATLAKQQIIINGQIIEGDTLQCCIDTTNGAVVIEDTVRIESFARISGPAWISKGTIIGQYANVSHSYIGSNSRIREGSNVNYCFIGNQVSLHRSNLENSILCNQVTASIGTTAVNTVGRKNVSSLIGTEKIDTGYPHLGVSVGCKTFLSEGVIIMPGVKIGENVFVMPGLRIYTDPLCIDVNGKLWKDNIRVSLASESQQKLEYSNR